jgi:S1-C subfamily serine protease
VGTGGKLCAFVVAALVAGCSSGGSHTARPAAVTTSTLSTTESSRGILGVGIIAALSPQSHGSLSPGAHVSQAMVGEPAANAGIAKGDIIDSIGGKPVASAADLDTVLRRLHPGDVVRVTWMDTSGRRQSAMIRLASSVG